MPKIDPKVKKLAFVEQDDRAKSLYSTKPIIFPKDQIQGLVEDIVEEYEASSDWIKKNYEDEWIDNLADYQGIPSEMFLPWPDANKYFLPAELAGVEQYASRFMESIRGAREFISCLPRGRNDMEIAEINEQLLRQQFEQEMDGYQTAEGNFRMKTILGTNITSSPYALDQCVRKLEGTYIWDKTNEEWLQETEAEQPDEELRGPKDFSGVGEDELKVMVASNKDWVIRDLFETVTVKDGPDWINHDIFMVKPDPNGGNDIRNHYFVIFESSETVDSIKRKVAQNIYDANQAEALINSLSGDEDDMGDSRNDGERRRDAVEGYTVDIKHNTSIKIWTRYGRHILPDLDLEEETISVVANGKYLLRCARTPFEDEGVTYRPIYVDRFIELPYRFYGIGVCSITKNLNRLLNHLVNQVLNHGDMYNSPTLVHPLDGQWRPDTTIVGPGQTIASDNSDGFKFLNPPDIKSSHIDMIEFIRKFMDQILGVHDFTQTSGALSTAHGLANVLREANRLLDFYAKKSHEGVFKQLFTNMLRMNKKFMDPRYIRKITDKEEWEMIFVDEKNVSSDLDVKIFADSVTSSREFDQQKWANLSEAAVNTVDPATGKAKYDNVKIMDQVFKAWGEAYPEIYHTQETVQQKEVTGEAPGTIEGAGPQAPEVQDTAIDQGGLGDVDASIG